MPGIKGDQDRLRAELLMEETVEIANGTTKRTRRLRIGFWAVGVVLIAAELLWLIVQASR